MISGALLLTAGNLAFRLLSMGFHVVLTRRLGAEGLGSLQLVLSVGGFLLIGALAGGRTAAMYLTGEGTGKAFPACAVYGLLCSSGVGLAAFFAAPFLSRLAAGSASYADSLRLCACFLPINSLLGVLGGVYTAQKRIKTLMAAEAAEQLLAYGITLGLMDVLPPVNAVLLGSGIGSVASLMLLLYLRRSEASETAIPLHRVARTALPLGVGDLLRTGLGTAETMLIPKRLGLYADMTSPLAAFGVLTGMVFPIAMFPTCLLFGFCQMLIPELSAAKGQRDRVEPLVHQTLHWVLLLGSLYSGLLLFAGDSLCVLIYQNRAAGKYLYWFAPMIPMLYCDAVTDAMTKGLGQQRYCVRYNLLTAGLDIVFLWILLPKFGIVGFYLSFFLTHSLNFGLSLHRLCHITGITLSPLGAVMPPAVCWAASLAASRLPIAAAVLFYILAAAAVWLAVWSGDIPFSQLPLLHKKETHTYEYPQGRPRGFAGAFDAVCLCSGTNAEKRQPQPVGNRFPAPSPDRRRY